MRVNSARLIRHCSSGHDLFDRAPTHAVLECLCAADFHFELAFRMLRMLLSECNNPPIYTCTHIYKLILVIACFIRMFASRRMCRPSKKFQLASKSDCDVPISTYFLCTIVHSIFCVWVFFLFFCPLRPNLPANDRFTILQEKRERVREGGERLNFLRVLIYVYV